MTAIQKRLLMNFILLFHIIGIAVFLVTREEQPVEQADIKITTIDPKTVQTIHLKKRNTRDIIFYKQEQYWHMQQPFNLLADHSRIDIMLELLQARSYKHFSAADNDLSGFMLAAPEVSILFDETQIFFGAQHPLDKKTRYIRSKDTIHVIDDSLFYHLRAPATFFLEPKLIPPNTSIQAIHFPTITITENSTLNTHKQILSAWSAIKAVAVRNYEKVLAIDHITVKLSTGTNIRFTIIAEKPNLILARIDQNIQYHIGSDTADQLFLKQ